MDRLRDCENEHREVGPGGINRDGFLALTRESNGVLQGAMSARRCNRRFPGRAEGAGILDEKRNNEKEYDRRQSAH